MDVENNFRAAVDDTRRWAAIMGTIPLLFLVEEEEGLLEEVVSRSIVKSQTLSVCVMRFASLATAVVVSY